MNEVETRKIGLYTERYKGQQRCGPRARYVTATHRSNGSNLFKSMQNCRFETFALSELSSLKWTDPIMNFMSCDA